MSLDAVKIKLTRLVVRSVSDALTVNRFVTGKASSLSGKQKDVSSIHLRLTFVFKSYVVTVVCGHCLNFCDFAPHN